MSNDKAALYVLSSSEALINSVHSILGSIYQIVNARNLEEGLKTIERSQASLCIVDFTVARSRGSQAITQLKKHNSDLVVLLVCPREQKSKLLETNLSNEAYRVLFTPLSPGQTKLSLTAAVKLLESRGKTPHVLQTQIAETPESEPLVDNIFIEKTSPVKAKKEAASPVADQFDDFFLGKKHSTRLNLEEEPAPPKPAPPKPAPPKPAPPKPAPPKPEPELPRYVAPIPDHTPAIEPFVENIFIEKSVPVKPKVSKYLDTPTDEPPAKPTPEKRTRRKKAKPKSAPPKPVVSEPVRVEPSIQVPSRTAPPKRFKPKRSLAKPTIGTQGKPIGKKILPIIASVGLIAVIGSAWFFLKGNNTDTSKEIAKLELEKNQAEIERLLQSAQTALLNNNRYPPAENNALDSYLEILDIEGNNQTALDAVTELSKQVFGDLDLQIANGDINRAKRSVATARKRAENSKIFSAMVESQLSEKKTTLLDSSNIALATGNRTDATKLIRIAKAVFGSDDAEIKAISKSIPTQQNSNTLIADIELFISQAQTALQADRLLAPDQNSAQYFIQRLESLSPTNSRLVLLKQEFVNALLLKAKAATENNDFIATQNFLDAAYSAGAETSILNIELLRLSDARIALQNQTATDDSDAQTDDEEQLLNELNQADLENKADEAPLAKVDLIATPLDVALSELSTTKRTAPVFPRRLEDRGISGSALINFTVNTDGSVSSIEVISVDPESASAFGTAAVKAVEDWTFEPYVDAEGNVRIANSQIKINFTLD